MDSLPPETTSCTPKRVSVSSPHGSSPHVALAATPPRYAEGYDLSYAPPKPQRAKRRSPGRYIGQRVNPDEHPAVTVRRVMLLPMTPRCRRWLETSLELGGSLDAGAAKLGLSAPSQRKELSQLRRLAECYHLVVRG